MVRLDGQRAQCVPCEGMPGEFVVGQPVERVGGGPGEAGDSLTTEARFDAEFTSGSALLSLGSDS